MKIINKLFFLFVLFAFAQAIQACDNHVVTVESCLGETKWSFPNYDAVKDVCGGVPISLDIRCSPGSVLYSSDQVCMYEVYNNGTESLVYCSTYGSFAFTPDDGKKYRLEVNRYNAIYHEVTFNSVNCLEFETNTSTSCVMFDRRVELKLKYEDALRSDYCYFYEWDFGDGSPVVNTYTEEQVDHTYNYTGTNNCKNYTVTVKAIPSGFCEGCEEEYVSTQTVKVCRFCEVSGEEINPISLTPYPNPTGGPLDLLMEYSGDHVLQRLVINRIADGTPIYEEPLPADIIFPYTHFLDLSDYPTGSYNIVVISDQGLTGSVQIFKE